MVELQQIISEIHLMTPSFGAIFAIVLAGILLVFSGFASGSEIAFFSLSPADLSELEEERTERDRQILQLRADSERTLATILIANNLVNVTIIMLCNYFFSQVVNFGRAYWVEFLCITVVLTFLILLFGEIMPKIYTRQQPLRFCRTVVGHIRFFRRLFWPFETILMKSGILAGKVIQKENHILSVDAYVVDIGAADLAQSSELRRFVCGEKPKSTHARLWRRVLNRRLEHFTWTALRVFILEHHLVVQINLPIGEDEDVVVP